LKVFSQEFFSVWHTICGIFTIFFDLPRLQFDLNINKFKKRKAMSTNSNAGSMKAPTARYNAPQNKSAKVHYYIGVCNKMLEDSRFSDSADKINDALSLIEKFRKAIIKAFTRAKGTKKARDVAEFKMKSKMNYLLGIIQEVADNDPEHAIALFESLGVSYKKRYPYHKDQLRVMNGRIRGTMDLQVKMPDGIFAVIWFYTIDPANEDSWKLADFSHTSKGSISGLIRTTTYYFRAKISSSETGKSDWSNVVEIICS
jgi:hypothetical protein